MAKIFEEIPMLPEKMIGTIDKDGRIYAKFEEGQEDEYLGWIDYEEGDVYDAEDGLMGWIEEDREVIASYEEDDFAIGRVGDDGKLYLYSEEEEEDIFVGKITEMEDAADGAAALLFFFDEVEFEEEE